MCLNTEQPGQSQGGVKDMACIAGRRGDHRRGNGLVHRPLWEHPAQDMSWAALCHEEGSRVGFLASQGILEL